MIYVHNSLVGDAVAAVGATPGEHVEDESPLLGANLVRHFY